MSNTFPYSILSADSKASITWKAHNNMYLFQKKKSFVCYEDTLRYVQSHTVKLA
jgi:hypothetical protein